MPQEPTPSPGTQLSLPPDSGRQGRGSPEGPPPPKGASSGGHRFDRLKAAAPLSSAVDVVQAGIAVVLLVIAVIVLIRTFVSFVDSPGAYPQSVIDAIDGVLVVIILVDVLRTVLTHFEGSGFPLQPFLIIGIISAVRDILSVSARLALQTKLTQPDFERSAIELGVSSLVALALAAALVITRSSTKEEEGTSA